MKRVLVAVIVGVLCVGVVHAEEVVYLQGGHDHFAYENPNYRQILKQAIEWTAKRR